MDFTTEVRVKQISVERLLKEYWTPEPVREACEQCPYYGKVWSCPPGVPYADKYLKRYESCFLIGVKTIYAPCVLESVKTPQDAQNVRNATYERVKKYLLLTLLELEREVPEGECLGAGRCVLCSRCARRDEAPCRYPELKRYSLTSFGFDFTKMTSELLGVKLVWSAKGLPEYDTAVAALFYKRRV